MANPKAHSIRDALVLSNFQFSCDLLRQLPGIEPKFLKQIILQKGYFNAVQQWSGIARLLHGQSVQSTSSGNYAFASNLGYMYLGVLQG